MPLSYLEGTPQDVSAVNRMGSTFSDALLGLQANKIAQQRWMAQQVMEQQRVGLERQRLMDEMKTSEVQRSELGARTEDLRAKTRDTQTQTSAGQDLGFDLRQYGELQKNADMHPELIAAILSQIAKQQGVIASASPANIGSNVPRIMESMDPRMRALIATGTKTLQPVPAGGSLYDTVGRQPIFTAPGKVSSNPEKMQLDRIKALATAFGQGGRALRPDTEIQSTLHDQLIQALQQGQGQGQDTNQPSPFAIGGGRQVRVRNKAGQTGTITINSDADLQQAQAEGYTIIQ